MMSSFSSPSSFRSDLVNGPPLPNGSLPTPQSMPPTGYPYDPVPVNAPVPVDTFNPPDAESTKAQKANAAKNAKKPHKDFNVWKWIVLTPLIAGVMLPFASVGVAGLWFMHTPSSLSKTMKPDDLKKMLAAYANQEKVEIPKGLRIPKYKGSPDNLMSSIKMSLSIFSGYVNALRHLPADNKWQIFKYTFSRQGIKDFMQIPQIFIDILGADLDKLNKRDLSYIANVLTKGGTVTKKYGQSLADVFKNITLRKHAEVLRLEKAKAPAEEIQIARTSFESSRKFYQTLSKLQSQEVELTPKEKRHFEYLYKEILKKYQAKYPHAKMDTRTLDAIKKVAASTAVVALPENLAIKMPKTDARATNAINNLEALVGFQAIEHAVKACIMPAEKEAGKQAGKAVEKVEKEVLKNMSNVSEDAIIKAAAQQAGSILDGADFTNEAKGLNAMREMQEAMGIKVGLAPKPLLVDTIIGKDGERYSVVVMEQIEGPGDLSKVIEKAVMSEHPFDLSSKEWQDYHRFMRKDALPTIAMQSLKTRNGDGHGGNFMLKSLAQQEALEKLGAKAVNGGSVPIDLAEYLELSDSSMKSIAQLSLACVKTGSETDMGAREQARRQAMKSLDAVLGKQAHTISMQDKYDLLTHIEASPLRILGKLYENDKIADILHFPDSHGVNAQTVKRAEKKFTPLITEVADYVKTLEPKSPELAEFKKSREAASELFLKQMEDYAGTPVSGARRKTYVNYINSRLLNTYGTDELNPEKIKAAIKDRDNAINTFKEEIEALKDMLLTFGT
ncbi:MAG: hypothetical protein HEQ32_03885 [Vampirovibrio sp.]